MKRLSNFTAKTLIASGLSLFLISSMALAQPPGGRKGKGDREGGERGQRGGNPAEVAAKMIQEHDKSGDGELQVAELGAALTAQRQQRGAGQRGQQGMQQAGQRKRGPGGAGSGQRGRAGQKPGAGGKGSQAKRGAGNPGAGQRGGAAGGAGKRGAAAGGAGARGPGQQGDASRFAAKILSDFDKDGSKGLNARELTASLEAQRENRGGRGRPGAGEGRPGDQGKGPGKAGARQGGKGKGEAGGKGGKGKGRRGGEEESKPGAGVSPKRPSV